VANRAPMREDREFDDSEPESESAFSGLFRRRRFAGGAETPD
jgi:hypothetical protein